MATETLNEITTAVMVGGASIPMRAPIPVLAKAPIMIPMIPPMELVTSASMTNCNMITLFFAPRAFLIPISLVLSVTDTSMMFMTPTPATKREIPAIPPSIMLIMAICSFKESRRELIAVTV